MAPREVLKGRMLQVARDGQYESPIKALMSGATTGGKNGHHTNNRGTSGLNVR